MDQDLKAEAAPLPPRRKLTDVVREHILTTMAENRLGPGDAIPSEGDISRQLRVSKPVVREALRDLAAFGVVEIRQGRPTEVRAMDEEPLIQFFDFASRSGDKSMVQFMELIRSIECDAAGLAAQRRTEDDLADLDRVMEELRLASGDSDNWNTAHWEFHLVIVQAAKNDLMLFIFRALKAVIIAQKKYMFAHAAHRHPPHETLVRQGAIYDAIVRQDVVGARKTMRAHFDYGIAATETYLRELAGR